MLHGGCPILYMHTRRYGRPRPPQSAPAVNLEEAEEQKMRGEESNQEYLKPSISYRLKPAEIYALLLSENYVLSSATYCDRDYL